MPRRWRGVVTIENVQTGDGRVMAPGSIEWATMPLPLAWLRDGDQHVSLTEVAPQIGTIDSLERVGDEIVGEGSIDDSNPDGAEVVRRMDDGSAPLGNRFPISIDPDNWEVEVVATDVAEAEDIIVIASGQGPLTRQALAAAILNAVRAAAGDPDPGPDGGEGGEVLFQDSVDEILERYTRLRIRGATLCSVAAFDGASIELVAVGAEAAPPATAEGVTAAVPARPPVAWFQLAEPEPGDDRLVQQIDGGWAVPLTILDSGQVFGHIARAGQSHRGYAQHVPPPTSRTAYREFHVGQVQCEGGELIATGALVVGCDHAPDSMTAGEARDHYANSGLGWADGRVVDGTFGPWFCGALRPGLTDDDLRVLRALTPSGDWRPWGGNLELVSILAVNTPGFPVAREHLAAAALVASVGSAPAAPRLRVVDGEVRSLVAAGMVARCGDCAERARLTAAMGDGDVMAELRQLRSAVARIERRTRHLEPVAAAAMRGRVHVQNYDAEGKPISQVEALHAVRARIAEPVANGGVANPV